MRDARVNLLLRRPRYRWIPGLRPAMSAASRPLRNWAWAIRVLCLVGATLVFTTPLSLSFQALPIDIMSTADAPATQWPVATQAQRVRAVLATLLPTLAGLYALLQLWRLVGHYARGEVFSVAAVSVFNRFAHGMLAYWLMKIVGRPLMSVALTWDHPPGGRVFLVGIGSDDFGLLLVGVVLAIIARVMQQAAQLAEDNAGIV